MEGISVPRAMECPRNDLTMIASGSSATRTHIDLHVIP